MVVGASQIAYGGWDKICHAILHHGFCITTIIFIQTETYTRQLFDLNGTTII